jgi:hypothetical protein
MNAPLADRIVTVFGSSSPRTPAPYLAAAGELGRLLATAGARIRNGAGKDGCMGACTDAALAAGGQVDGVILRRFAEEGHGHPALAGCPAPETMRERKRLLGEQVDAFIALPGGPGTWEELCEVAVERQIRTHQRPLLLIDVQGCYAGLRQLAERAAADGLLYGPIDELFTWVATPQAAVTALVRQLQPPASPACPG